MYIYDIDSEIELEIEDGVCCTFKPLTFKQKNLIKSTIQDAETTEQFDQSSHLAVKFSLKKISGLKNDFQIDLENDVVTDRCMDSLHANKIMDKIETCAMRLIDGIGEKLVIPDVKVIAIREPYEKKK